MTSLRHILGLCPLCALPVAVGQLVFAAESPAEICRKLVDATREVDRLLRTVADQESGRKVAGELKPLLEYMHRETGRLCQLPIGGAEDARMLEQSMRDLLHITQGYMPVVQRLNEVNAYGAEELIQLFRFYKMSAPNSLAGDRRDETPLVRSYGEWCDSMDDVVYLLRRAMDADSASAVVADLQVAVQRMEERAAQVERLQSGLAPRQVETERVPLNRLMRLRSELRAEQQRLHAADAYGVAELVPLLERCAREARG